ncbi:MAG: cell division protein FtsZ [Leptothrix sp. (in: Bacteria)]|nr:cell division protein FtsZ [Leptothrix sp. (in: b-proteobacteria)]
MSLGTALALFGGVVLLALALHGWWSMRRAARRASPAAEPAADRVEPSMDGALAAVEAEPAALRQPPRRTPRLDALIDALVPLALDSPISGDMALQHLPPSRRAGGKPFYVEGLDTETGAWETLQPGRRYGELLAGVQLASRGGPLTEIEYSEFVQKVQDYADAVGASTDPPDMLEVVARARELDALASPLDVQLTVTLRTNGVAWSVPFVQQVAARQGLVPGAVHGRMVLPSEEEGAPPVLVLSVDAQAALAAMGDNPQAAAVRQCMLTLDVPQTPATTEPYPAWHLMGKRLADDLDATAVDDHGEAISLHAFAAIGQELDEIYSRLEALGLAAGTAAARRLFS